MHYPYLSKKFFLREMILIVSVRSYIAHLYVYVIFNQASGKKVSSETAFKLMHIFLRVSFVAKQH